MAQIRINTRSRTKEKPYMINSKFLQNREGKQVKNCPFFQWAPHWNLISKKETNYIFQKKITWTTQKRHNFACDNYIFHKTRGNKNKQWTHYSALQLEVTCQTGQHLRKSRSSSVPHNTVEILRKENVNLAKMQDIICHQCNEFVGNKHESCDVLWATLTFSYLSICNFSSLSILTNSPSPAPKSNHKSLLLSSDEYLSFSYG